MPHEAGLETCTLTGKRLPEAKRKVVSRPPELPPRLRPAPSLTPAAVSIGIDDLESGVGERLIDGKYRVEGLIGRGAMGSVYAAEHVLLSKKVAIKVLHRRGGGAADVKRFLREARVVGSLGHPNIVQVFDLGALGDGAPYLVMDRLEGETLADRLEVARRLDPQALLKIMTEVLSALAAAHDRAIVHRDLKPDNIFLARGPRGRETAKLLDFGISKSLQDENTLSLTRTGAVVGTPYYLAPEQARGDAIDHRVDVWAAGVVMYEAGTGMMPFNAPNYNALLTKILHQRPRPPRSVRPDLPPSVEAIIVKALAFEPSARFESADAMLAAVEAAARGGDDASPTEVTDRFALLDDLGGPTQVGRIGDDDRATIFDARASDVHDVGDVSVEEDLDDFELDTSSGFKRS